MLFAHDVAFLSRFESLLFSNRLCLLSRAAEKPHCVSYIRKVRRQQNEDADFPVSKRFRTLEDPKN